jgi:hypothetical protein
MRADEDAGVAEIAYRRIVSPGVGIDSPLKHAQRDLQRSGDRSVLGALVVRAGIDQQGPSCITAWARNGSIRRSEERASANKSCTVLRFMSTSTLTWQQLCAPASEPHGRAVPRPG